MVTIFVFTKCAGKIAPKKFALHQDTVQDIKQKDIHLEVSNIKLSSTYISNFNLTTSPYHIFHSFYIMSVRL